MARLVPLLLAFTISGLVALGSAGIFYEGCNAVADRPEVGKGFFYDLCIRDEKFVGRNHPFQFIESDVSDTQFEKCTFVNTETHSVNFTNSVFTNVLFKNSVFSSRVTNPTPVLLEKTVMESTTFEGCTFDRSAALEFSSFKLSNVTFSNCTFESDTTFSLGQLQDVNFIGCKFQRGANAKVSSESNAVKFSEMTLQRMNILESQFQHPIVFQYVNGGDVTFNDTRFDEFWCHGREQLARGQVATSAFNDSVFQRSEFTDKVYCDRTTWRRFTMLNSTFRKDADFSRSNFEDIHWDTVNQPEPVDKTCLTLDMSRGTIFREVLANMTISCQLDMMETKISQARFVKVKARDFIFKDSVINVGFIDGRCCTEICPQLQCRCNYTRSPTDTCPQVEYPFDLNAKRSACFSAGSNLHVEDGTVRMADVRHGARALVGNAQYSDVYFFGHRSAGSATRFVRIAHSGQEKPLVISQDHYLYVNDRLATASSVRVGDQLRDAEGYAVLVTGVDSTVERGLYAPTSLQGDLIVDGVRVSSYTAAVHPTLAHWLLSPLRLAYRAGLRRFVERFNILHQTSLEPVARALRIPPGPRIVRQR